MFDDEYEEAKALAIRCGAIKVCEHHDDVTIDQMDEDAVKKTYATATVMIKNGDIDYDRKEFMNVIKHVIEDSAFDCPACERHLHD